MNSSKIIDISKSSLVGLKAELLKKKEEVKRLKDLQQDNVNPLVKKNKRSNEENHKSNYGVERRNCKDEESLHEDDFDVLRKSREKLEAKSKLYKLKETFPCGADNKSKYLIDFELKHEIYKGKEQVNKDEESAEEESNYVDSNSDPESNWVDFVDTLGRSRRCLKKDLPEMRAKDEKLAASLRPSSPPVSEITPELLSWDMQREMMRKKWEEQETVLLGKKNIHYQDIRFDEARPHGVGYFEFSLDESERLRQQEALKNLRNETLEQQEAAVGLRIRRQQQLQARLAAARRRRRERLGLLLEEETQKEEDAINLSNSNEDQEKKAEDTVIDLEESIKKIAPERPWDIGKQVVNSVMTQEEWVDKKREERNEEFRPPACILENEGPGKRKQNLNIFSSRKANRNQHLHNSKTTDKRTGPEVEDSGKLKNVYNVFSLENSSEEMYFGPLMEQSNSAPNEISLEKINTDLQCDHTLSKLKQIPNSSSSDLMKSKFEQEKHMTKVADLDHTAQKIDFTVSKCKSKCFTPSVNEDGKKNVMLDSDVLLVPVLKEQEGEENMALTNMSSMYPKMSTHEKNVSCLEGNPQLLNLQKREESVYNNDSSSMSSSAKYSIPQTDVVKRKWAEIGPPSLLSHSVCGTSHKTSHSNVHLEKSIAMGLNFLKTCTEQKEKKRLKGLLDII